MSEKLDELKEQLEALSDKIDEISDNIESTIEDAVDDAVGDIGGNGEASKMYILSQDGKLFAPFTYIEAVRIRKGEEPYAINLSLRSCIGRRVGKYENKEAALAEMRNIVNAFRNGESVYEVK